MWYLKTSDVCARGFKVYRISKFCNFCFMFLLFFLILGSNPHPVILHSVQINFLQTVIRQELNSHLNYTAQILFSPRIRHFLFIYFIYM